MTIKDAWYESTFLITGYNVCDEGDFSGALVAASGLSENHKSDFLYSARGIPMQGTGRAPDGRFIRLAGGLPGGWHRNAAGNPDVAASPDRVAFAYATAPIGAFGAVSENRSIAVDRRVMPPRASVDIDGVGTRIADDTGSAIRAYHIDNFLGAGQAVVTAWVRGAVNGTQRKLKFIGRST